MKLKLALTVFLWIFCISVSETALASCKFINVDERQTGSESNSYARCDYKAFSTISYCPLKIPLLSWTTIYPDTGDADTSGRNYKLDPSAAALECQQISSATYSSIKNGYDVGHLTAIDLLDYDKDAALETNYMTNLIPQHSSLNRHGAWRKTERLTECYREDYKETQIFSGVLTGTLTQNDHFISSHGLVKTPDRFWKQIKFESNDSQTFYSAWIFDNSAIGSRESLNEISVSVEELFNVINSEDETIYTPVIELLETSLPSGSQEITLSINRNCHSRNG